MQIDQIKLTIKPRPNDRNISTQHIATLLAQHLQAPAKRSQHFGTTYRNIVGRIMLRTFGHPVATRCDMLGIENRTSAYALMHKLLHEPGQTTTTLCNIHKCCMKNLTSFKFKASAQRSKHFNATYRNIVGRHMLCAFRHLLRRVATCWVLLAQIWNVAPDGHAH